MKINVGCLMQFYGKMAAYGVTRFYDQYEFKSNKSLIQWQIPLAVMTALG